MAILLAVTPVTYLRSPGWMMIAQNYAHDTLKADIRVVQDKIGAQDLLIVNAQRPELLPLELQVEVHLQSDRIAIAYRRWLHRLGLTFGMV